MRTFVSQTEEQCDTVYCTIYLPIHVTSIGFLSLHYLDYLQLNSTQLNSSILTPLPSLLTSPYTDLLCEGCVDGKAEAVAELSIRGGKGRQYECYTIQGRKTRLNLIETIALSTIFPSHSFSALLFCSLFCSALHLCFLLFSSLPFFLFLFFSFIYFLLHYSLS